MLAASSVHGIEEETPAPSESTTVDVPVKETSGEGSVVGSSDDYINEVQSFYLQGFFQKP